MKPLLRLVRVGYKAIGVLVAAGGISTLLTLLFVGVLPAVVGFIGPLRLLSVGLLVVVGLAQWMHMTSETDAEQMAHVETPPKGG